MPGSMLKACPGASGVSFGVYRGGSLVGTVVGHAFTDALPRGTRGTVTYQVCQVGPSVCSSLVTVVV